MDPELEFWNPEYLTKNGRLGHWQGDEYDINLQEGAKPYHAKAFPIPYVHLETLRAEVQQL
jgi:hypothetical protein